MIKSSDVDNLTPHAQKVCQFMTILFTIPTQMVSYAIVLSSILTIGLDLLFISIPILQDSLSGGSVDGQQVMQAQ